jgi:UDP-N-acetylmuramoyl-L-alanyl-D-glutamate--2,6-diaminopimelate ligase
MGQEELGLAKLPFGDDKPPSATKQRNRKEPKLKPLGLREYTEKELAGGFTEKGYIAVGSRREAIRLAVSVAETGDIVLLAGKGHEEYQLIGSEKLHFDDREEAANAFRDGFQGSGNR